MKRIDQYIFKQVFVTSFIAVAFFAIILIIGNLLRDAVGMLSAGQLPIWGFIKLMFQIVPYVFAYALPLGMLTGILIVFGRLSSQNELTAMRAAGLSIYRISVPILWVVLIGVSLALWVNLYYGPKAKSEFRMGLTQEVHSNPLRFIQANTFIKDFPGYIIFLGKRAGRDIEDFWIWELDEQKKVRLFIKAKEGKLIFDSESEDFLLTLYNGSGEKKKDHNPEDTQNNSLLTIFFKETTIKLPLDGILNRGDVQKKISMMTAPELLHYKQQMESANNSKEALKASLQLQKNLAMGFSILALATIAIPLALKTNRSETYFNMAIALGLALSYYFIIIILTWFQNKPSYHPDLLVWLPNLVYFSLGAYLLKRANS